MNKRTALVVGATGLIGKELVKLLLESPQYQRVEVLLRRPLEIEHRKLNQHIVNFDHLSELKLIQPIDDVFCSLGTTIKKAKTKEQFQKVDLDYPLEVAKLAKKHGADHFLVVSAIGADSHSSIFYNHTKGKVEEELMALDLPRLSIFRPSILIGERNEFRLGERMGIAVVKLFKFALIGKLKRYRGIEASKIAAGMVSVALSPKVDPIHIFESEEIEQLS